MIDAEGRGDQGVLVANRGYHQGELNGVRLHSTVARPCGGENWQPDTAFHSDVCFGAVELPFACEVQMLSASLCCSVASLSMFSR